MNPTPLVSVIVPCHGQARFLPGAIESLLAQDYPAVEIIVVNDGEEDEVDAVASRHTGAIRYFRQSHSGLSLARNRGIQESTGEFLLFLDADDLLHPEAVTRLVGAVHGSPDRVAVMGYHRFDSDPRRSIEPPVLPQPASAFLPWLFRTCYAVHAHLCPRTLVTDLGGFDESLTLAQDLWLWWQLALRGTGVVAVPWVGAYYRQTPGSLTSYRGLHQLACGEVVCKVFEQASRDPSFLGTWGPEFLRFLYGVRRRLMVFFPESPVVHRLWTSIQELRSRGHRVRGPWPLRLQDSMPEGMSRRIEAFLVGRFRTLSGSREY